MRAGGGMLQSGYTVMRRAGMCCRMSHLHHGPAASYRATALRACAPTAGRLHGWIVNGALQLLFVCRLLRVARWRRRIWMRRGLRRYGAVM